MNPADGVKIKATNQENYVPVITRKEAAKVRINDIYYIETQLRIVNIYTENRIFRFYGKMDDIEKYLDSNFYRCHKSCVINLNKIVRMEDGVLYFPDGSSLRVGQNNYRHTRHRYISFLKQTEF